MADERVLNVAMSEKAGCENRIAQLRAEIQQQEQQISEIDKFVAMFRRYESMQPVA